MKQQIYKQSFISVSIIDHYQKLLDKNYKTFYKVELKTFDNVLQKEKITETHKTYEMFEGLYNIVKKNYCKDIKFPSKGLISFKSKEELDKRKAGLEIFLKSCFQIRKIVDDFIFKEFIGNYDIDIESIVEINSKSMLKIIDLIVFENKKFIGGILERKENSQILYVTTSSSWKGNSKKTTNPIISEDNMNLDINSKCKNSLIAYNLYPAGAKRLNKFELFFTSNLVKSFLQNNRIIAGLENGTICYQKIDQESVSESQSFKIFKKSKLKGLGADTEKIYALSNSKIKYVLIKDSSIVYGK